MEWLSRTKLLLGEDRIKKLQEAHVLIVGLGGVGGYACEQIARGGVGKMTIVDADIVSESNINRQLIASHSAVGQTKASVLAGRLRDINPNIDLNIIEEFIFEEKVDELLDRDQYDYVVDAIDTLSPKVNLIYKSLNRELRIVSSFGAGGRVDPTQVQIAPIEKSHGDKLGFHVRKRLHRMGIRKGLKVVFSPEQVPEDAWYVGEGERNKKGVVGTISYMPPIFGCALASVVLRDLAEY
jgi:tRNA A37 threonylcarbamoyladenosine dehydratase